MDALESHLGITGKCAPELLRRNALIGAQFAPIKDFARKLERYAFAENE